MALTNIVANDTNVVADDNAVVWKLSGEGTTLWAVRGGGEGPAHLTGVAVDGAGAVVAAGKGLHSSTFQLNLSRS